MGLIRRVTSRPLSRHRSVLAPRLPLRPVSHVDSLSHEPKHLAGAFPPFSMCGSRNPSSRLAASGKACLSPGSPAFRVWLPSGRPSFLGPSEASFSPQRSWASLFRAFLLHKDRKTLSDSPLRSHALFQTLAALDRRLSGLLPS